VQSSFEVPSECSVELSPHGYQFFAELFQTFDKDKDGALNRTELDSLFSTSPGNPWANTGFPHTTITTETGSVTLQGWLAQWRYILHTRLHNIYTEYTIQHDYVTRS
jgi:Ras family protein T1